MPYTCYYTPINRLERNVKSGSKNEQLSSSRQNHTMGREGWRLTKPKGTEYRCGTFKKAEKPPFESTTSAPMELVKFRSCCLSTVCSPLARYQRPLHPSQPREPPLSPNAPDPEPKSGMRARVSRQETCSFRRHQKKDCKSSRKPVPAPRHQSAGPPPFWRGGAPHSPS